MWCLGWFRIARDVGKTVSVTVVNAARSVSAIFVSLTSQHAYKLTNPITPYALAVYKTRWRRSGEQVNTNDQQLCAVVYAPYL